LCGNCEGRGEWEKNRRLKIEVKPDRDNGIQSGTTGGSQKRYALKIDPGRKWKTYDPAVPLEPPVVRKTTATKKWSYDEILWKKTRLKKERVAGVYRLSEEVFRDEGESKNAVTSRP